MKPACKDKHAPSALGRQLAHRSAREWGTGLLDSPGDAENGGAHHGVPHGEAVRESRRVRPPGGLTAGSAGSYMVTMLGFLDEASELPTLKAVPSGL